MDLVGLLGKEVFLCPLFLVCRSSGVSVCVCVRARTCAITQSCPTLCDPMNCSPPGSSVHGILQATILEQVAMPSSSGSSPQGSDLHLLHWQVGSLPLSHLGSPRPKDVKI